MMIMNDKEMSNKEPYSQLEIEFSKEVIDYDPDRFDILLEFFPKDLVNKVVEYDCDHPIRIAYDKTIKKCCKNNSAPSLLCESLKSVTFINSDDLEAKLLDNQFIADIKTLFKSSPYEYNDSSIVNFCIFITKSLLIMRQKYSNIDGQDQENWEKISKNMKLLDSNLRFDYLKDFFKVTSWEPFYYHLDSLYFLKFECLRRWKRDLKPKLENLFNDFYSKKHGSCSTIISNHFNGGKRINLEKQVLFDNFKSYLNRDPLLAFLWRYQDPSSWNKCCDSSKTLDSYFIDNLEMKAFKEKKNQTLTLVFDFSFLLSPKLDLKLVLENNHRIDFYSLYSKKQNFLELLKVFKKLNRLTWKDLLNIFDFRNLNEYAKHLKLKRLLKEEISLFGTKEFPIYIETMKSCNDYEDKMEETRLKLNVTKIKSIQYEKYYGEILGDLGYKDPFNPELIKKNKLEFDRIGFLENFYKVMTRLDSFKDFVKNHNLLKLFFKWVVYINEEFKYINDLTEILTNTNQAYEQLKVYFPDPFSKYSIYDYSFVSIFYTSPQNLILFKSLFISEFNERIHEMKPKLVRALNTFYDPSPHQGSCDDLKITCFDERFGSNIILIGIIWILEEHEKYGNSRIFGLIGY